MSMSRKHYASDVSDCEWALVAPYLTLLLEESAQRTHALRASATNATTPLRAPACRRTTISPSRRLYQDLRQDLTPARRLWAGLKVDGLTSGNHRRGRPGATRGGL
jgi:hypothetical protein